MKMKSIIQSLVLLATTATSALAQHQPLKHLSQPSLLWNQAIQSPPGNGNVVQISPDDKWLYITSNDGKLSKLEPETGGYISVYAPERMDDDGKGGIIDPNDQYQWVTYGSGEISFHMDDGNDGDGDGNSSSDYLVYWVFSVPPPSTGLSPLSRVIAIRHDDSRGKEMQVLWTKTLQGNIEGTPVIGSEGKFIYFTMNGIPALPTPPPSTPPTAFGTNSPVTNSPTTSNPTIVTGTPTASPVVADVISTFSNSPTISPVTNTATTTSPVSMDTTTTTTNPTVVADTTTVSPTITNVFNLSSGASNNADSESDNDDTTSTNNNDDNPAYWWWVEDTGTQLKCVNNTNYPEEYLTNNETLTNNNVTLLFPSIFECCSANLGACEPQRQREHESSPQPEDRSLQTTTEKSGIFIVLSHPNNGEIVYSFDSRDELSIQKHNFAPLEIAHRPSYGNYNGGESNSQDVLMWGSKKGDDARQGETMLFQLPEDFDQFDSVGTNTASWRVRVLESVNWSTKKKPTFSKDGLNVYFTMSGNRFTGWNNGQKFDVVANLGPIPLPPQTDNLDSIGRPIVLANNDEVLLLASIDHNRMFGANAFNGGMEWMLNDMGTESIFTIPQISPAKSDGSDIAYFGKKNAVYAVNVTNGEQLWGKDGYTEPSSYSTDAPMVTDFSLSSTGEYLYYARSGKTISRLRIAEVIPSEAPTFTPSTKPSFASSSSPSIKPSVVASLPPSNSVIPTASISPTVTSSPSKDPDYIPPTLSPTKSMQPSMPPSVAQSESPSVVASSNPSLRPSITLRPSTGTINTSAPVVNASPIGTAAPTVNTGSPVNAGSPVTESPSSSPVANIPPSNNANPPSVAGAEQTPGDSTDAEENSSPLSMTAIIGIAVGGGIGLLLILGILWYVCKNKGSEDDGMDTEWQQSNNANEGNAGRDEGTTFQYGDEEGNSNNSGQGGEHGGLKW